MRRTEASLILSSRFGRSGRVAIVAFALFQLLLPGVFTVADGLAAVDNGTQVVQSHIEGFGHKGCPRVHQDDTCAVCQFLAHATATPHNTSCGIAIARVRATQIAAVWLDRVSARIATPSLPRAPPVT